MSDKTGISWTDATWNPVRGCSRVSEGCRNCYAEGVAARFSGPGQAYEGLADRARKGSKWTGVVRMIDDHLGDPLRWKEPRRIFVNSMSDLFHEALTDAQIVDVFAVMALAPRHTFQVLTKRAERMRQWMTASRSGYSVAGAVRGRAWEMLGRVGQGRVIARPDRYKHEGVTNRPWPLPNVWLGVSVENQEAADERIPELLRTPAAVRFLSCEPLLGDVNLDAIQIPGERSGLRFSALRRHHDDRFGQSDTVIDWVIAGCESGRGRRVCDVTWLRLLRDQCAAARVAYFLKQAEPAAGSLADSTPRPAPINIGNGAKWKQGAVIELPYLDGVQHAAFPEVTSG